MLFTRASQIEALSQPETPELKKAYRAGGCECCWVGPLLDCAGAVRAGGFTIPTTISNCPVDTVNSNTKYSDHKGVFLYHEMFLVCFDCNNINS